MTARDSEWRYVGPQIFQFGTDSSGIPLVGALPSYPRPRPKLDKKTKPKKKRKSKTK